MLSELYYNKYKILLILLLVLLFTPLANAQNAIWIEDFDDGGGGRWTFENAPGSMTNPTPAGIVGLTYGVNAAVAHDNWIINDRNTPELDANIVVGTSITNQGQFVRGRHYACSAPSDLPNPFINGAAPGPNQSLHITAYPTCGTLLYGGTAQSDDWNCISDPDNGDIQTQTEQITFLNNNIDASGKCNLVLTADFFLGGDSDGIKSHGTILYSVDAGVTWKILVDNTSSCSPFLAGTCNNWHRRSFAFPADANNQNDLRIAFRWYDDGDIDNTGDYALGASFNVDNLIITSCNPPVADFSVDHTSGCKNETFVFTDQSVVGAGYYLNCFDVLPSVCDVTAWSWSITKPGPPGGFVYVNGTNANSQNPEVQFTTNAVFTVTLTATNCSGDGVLVETGLIVITNCPPVANFTTSQFSACAVPAETQDTLSFIDLSTTPSTPITSWAWTFTPATVTYVNGTNATTQNVDVVFNAAGTYQVALTVTNSEGNDTETKIAYIEAIDCNCGGGGGGGPVTVFEEDFDGNGGAGSNWAVLNQSIGFQGDIANRWWISDAEDGNAPGMCGSAGSGDQSLHVSSDPGWAGDLGAAYEIGADYCNLFGFWCATTDKRSYSNTISTVGVTGLTLAFNYIERGEGTLDDATVYYSLNNGSTWLLLNNPAKTALTCNPQGIWTAYSFALPATCEGIATLRIAFRWVNNDQFGSDPSFAVDDITIIGTGGGAAAANTWLGGVSNDWNVAANWSDGLVPTSATDVLVPALANICGACVMPQISSPAVANNVCNFGVITHVGDNTLTIDGDLLNEGVITTTTTLANADVIFANAISVYKGSGTLYDVDVAVTSSDLTLETNMRPRSMNISTTGLVDLGVYTLAVNRNLSKSAGTFTAINGTVEFVDACGGCLDQTNTSDVSINANQVFGNVLVNKSTGIKASLVSGFNYTLNTPKTLTIQNGILDANTFTLNGTGNLTMTGGELQLAKCATIIPEITGIYTLPAGKITFDGVCAQTVKSTSVVGTNYFKVEFTGTNVKSLSGNTKINDSLVFDLPTTLGNYVNAGTDTLFVMNNNSGIVFHTGGHVLGNYSRAITPSGGDYIYHVGSNNADLETYFEPITLTPSGLTGPSAVTAKFLDLTPNPTLVVPSIIFGLAPTVDTIEQVETEGYWRMNKNNNLVSGTYTATVSPDQNYWTFAKVWGGGQYTLLKQSIEGDSWDYTAGGSRVNDSTTTNFSDFSNYALGYSKNNPLMPLAVEIIQFQAFCDQGYTYLSWATATETNAHSFIIERSSDGATFEVVGHVPAVGNSTSIIPYDFYDPKRNLGPVYYRLSEMDMDGEVSEHGVVYVDCSHDYNAFNVDLFPNPSSGMINLNIFSTKDEVANIRILDMTGKIVYQMNDVEIGKGSNIVTYSSEIESGVYFVAVDIGADRKVIRFSVAK